MTVIRSLRQKDFALGDTWSLTSNLTPILIFSGFLREQTKVAA